MVIFPFPTSWFSRRGENKNPTTIGDAISGRICFLPQVLNHKWGMEILPWVMIKEFYQSLLLLRWGLTFLYCKGKWSILTFFYSTDQKILSEWWAGLQIPFKSLRSVATHELCKGDMKICYASRVRSEVTSRVISTRFVTLYRQDYYSWGFKRSFHPSPASMKAVWGYNLGTKFFFG